MKAFCARRQVDECAKIEANKGKWTGNVAVEG